MEEPYGKKSIDGERLDPDTRGQEYPTCAQKRLDTLKLEESWGANRWKPWVIKIENSQEKEARSKNQVSDGKGAEEAIIETRDGGHKVKKEQKQAKPVV